MAMAQPQFDLRVSSKSRTLFSSDPLFFVLCIPILEILALLLHCRYLVLSQLGTGELICPSLVQFSLIWLLIVSDSDFPVVLVNFFVQRQCICKCKQLRTLREILEPDACHLRLFGFAWSLCHWPSKCFSSIFMRGKLPLGPSSLLIWNKYPVYFL